MTSQPYTFYGWELSLYSGKLRSYLKHKGVPYLEKPPNLWTFFVTAPRKVQAQVMPFIITPDGQAVGDTSDIIDHMEAWHPTPSVVPATPVQRFMAYLFELWGDEFWLPVAMHMRWNHPENLSLFVHDAGTQALPGFPKLLQKAIGKHMAGMMDAHRPRLGIVKPEDLALMDKWAGDHLDALDQHFALHPFLFGERPSLGDYGLMGPLYAHLGRDPWPLKNLIEPRRHLHAWIKRMNQPLRNAGDFLADDALAPTLDAAVRSIFDEMTPQLEGIVSELNAFARKRPKAALADRFLGEVSFPYADGTHHRLGMTYGLWMAQRALQVLAAMPPTDAKAVRDWVEARGGKRFLDLKIPALRRVGLSVMLEASK